MKVIHVPYCFRPDPVGGTEVYVEAVAREQQRRGLEVVVAAPAQHTSRHMDNGLPVHRFAVSSRHDLSSVYGAGDATASREFTALVAQEQPDIVHLHAFNSAVSARLTEATKRRGVRLVFTYHTPTVSCQRGTLLRRGHWVCDGRLDVHRCAGCALNGLGVGDRTASLLGALPVAVGRVAGGLGLAGGAWTGLRMTELAHTHHTAFHAFMRDLDRVVVPCRWAGELLAGNGVPREKLRLSRQGLACAPSEADRKNPTRGSGDLRIAFLGRLHPTKGVDMLLRAVAALPNARLHLDVFGIRENQPGDAYVQILYALAGGDPRVTLHAAVENSRVTDLLRGYDVLAAPSRWLETGPLVVLEAFAAGIPVIGSNLGGIAELIQDGVNGLLVEPHDVAAWSKALRRLTDEPDLLPRLRAGVRPPRRIDAVADDMHSLYAELVPSV